MTMQPSSLSKEASVTDPLLLRNMFGRFASGVTVISCEMDGKIHGMTANSFVSVSLDPPLALISINRSARMHELLSQTDRFGLAILGEDQADMSTHFAGRPIDGYQPDFDRIEETPVLRNALAWMVCVHETHFDVGDHTLFIGRLIDCGYQEETNPLLYFSGQYGALAR